jgi:hypothetical protein
MPILNLPAKCAFNAGAVAGSGSVGPDELELELEELLDDPPPPLPPPPPPPHAARRDVPAAVSKSDRRLIEAVSRMKTLPNGNSLIAFQ